MNEQIIKYETIIAINFILDFWFSICFIAYFFISSR